VAASLDDLLRIAARTLSGDPYALIGGCARNLYAPPRATRDVDLAVVLSPQRYAQLGAELRSAGFDRLMETTSDPLSALPDVALFSDSTGGRIDLLIAHTEFEERAIAQARAVQLPDIGVTLRVVLVSDLVIYKLLAGRPRDLIDVEAIARFQAAANCPLDWDYIEAECAQWTSSMYCAARDNGRANRLTHPGLHRACTFLRARLRSFRQSAGRRYRIARTCAFC
jgi:hypothetical protein